MKWLLGVLLGLNLFVFVLAMFAGDDGTDSPITELPETVAKIDLIMPAQNSGACVNFGPFEEQSIIEKIGQSLAGQEIQVRLLTEPARQVSAFRVMLTPESDAQIPGLGEQLNQVGIENFYHTQNSVGDTILSIGVFTYEKTASNLADSLVKNGLEAAYARETLDYPQRYWLNLDAQPDPAIVAEARRMLPLSDLNPNPAECEPGLPLIQPEPVLEQESTG